MPPESAEIASGSRTFWYNAEACFGALSAGPFTPAPKVATTRRAGGEKDP